MATNSYNGGNLTVTFDGTDVTIADGTVASFPLSAINVDTEAGVGSDGDDLLEAADGAGVFSGPAFITNFTYTGFTIQDDQGNELMVIQNTTGTSFRVILAETTVSINGYDVINGTLLGSDTTITADVATELDISNLCFLSGTKILTKNGYIVVDELKIDDELILDANSGITEPVKFIFKRDYQHPFVDKRGAYPICIKQGAIANNVPSSDLFVSPDHAILIEGVLAHAGTLVNGVSIYQVSEMPESFSYYHVELANHSLILAENVRAETYIDNVERQTFDNYVEYEALYGVAEEMTELEYPRAKSSRQLPKAIKQTLLARGEQLFPQTEGKVA